MPRLTTDSSWLNHFQLLRRSIQKMIINQYQAAKKLIEQALYLQSNNADCYFLYSLCLYWVQDWQVSSLMQAKAVQLNPLCQIYELPDRDGCLRIKKILNKAIQFEQRIQRQTTEQLPVNLWYQYSILFHEQTNYQMVEIIYQRLFNKFPDVYRIKTHAFLGNYSNMLYDLGKYQQAIMKYEFQIQHDNNQMRFYSNCSLLYTIIGNYEKAEKYIKVALNKMPNKSNFLFNYANVLSKVNRFQQSLSKIDQALKNDPKDPIFNLKYAINILLYKHYISQTSVFQKTLKIANQVLQKCVQNNSPDDANLNKRILSMKNIVCIKLFTQMIMELPFVKENGKNWSQQEKFLSYVSDYLIVGQATKLELNQNILNILMQSGKVQDEIKQIQQEKALKNLLGNENIKKLQNQNSQQEDTKKTQSDRRQIKVKQYKAKWHKRLQQTSRRVQIVRLKNWSQSSKKEYDE